MEKKKDPPGVMGGEAQLAQSRVGKLSGNASAAQTALPSMPSSPENMGFSGVCNMSQLPGLLMALPDDESGGVDG